MRGDRNEAGRLTGELVAPGRRNEVGVIVLTEARDEALLPATALSSQVWVVGVEARRPGGTSGH